MELQRISIRGFKSIEDVIFEPKTGFSCLVGSNGAGKSNFCDALMFFKNVVIKGVSSAIQEIGDKSLLTDAEETSFSLKIKNHENLHEYEYFLSINIQASKIISERLVTNLFSLYSRKTDIVEKLNLDKFNNILEDLVHKIKFIENNKSYKSYKSKEYKNTLNSLIDFKKTIETIKTEVPEYLRENIQDELSSDKTGLSSYFENEHIYEYISNLNIFRINPLAPKIPNKIINKSNLSTYGENLATILLELQNNEDKWSTLHELLNLIVPSISEISLKKGEFDDSLSLHFKEDTRILPAISISDGTIYTLAILTAILWNQDKNSLIIIEEPERGIHPQAIVELISFIKEIILENTINVIVTTHSETVVRNCSLEELWLVDKIKGYTKLKNAKTSNPHLEESSLDQAWLMNLLNGGLPW
ncbi:AAA family ATPase [Acinetobacter nosocomialis]|uniref:AAA family ATPase n=1 Tax=Acinetobacter nosocomialis TaxID=106654 RepID=UPI001F3020CC|nr:AAA family ATPase [Acinetobacter nosocomialis]MCE7532057.1 AAA family ATPase [Acinetobacter nosocomialis]